MPKLHVITYGCQMNEYDSERAAGLLTQGSEYELTDTPADADLILLNTCAIREKAEEKVFSKLGQLRALKQQNPGLMIGVMGCMAQLQKDAIQKRAPIVDLVFGSPAIARVGELVERVRRERRPILSVGEAPLVKLSTMRARPGLKAFVTVMEGCEKHCTFCVVPVTRGRERSHSPASILGEIRELARAGVREVTLLGQTVNAYGRDLTPPTDLAALLEMVNGIDGIRRIRFVTSNPYNLTSRLIRALRDIPKVCEALHLPLQSGSNRILMLMNRGYTRERYLELIAELRETVPGLALTTDLIVGFPGETDEDFDQTVDMVERVGYEGLFAFRYSRRPGTPAAAMPGQVPEDVKARRNTRVLEVAERVSAAKSRPLEGREMEIMVDGASKRDPRELSGRTRCNRVVNFDGQGKVGVGDVVHVCITQAMPHSLRGALVGEGAHVC
ncbi:MAG: tRNA (N6-isopentenyl adenosine(37)-C2)-methylthiotransferase MiaB [Candidatus Rokuibacteriota bacterium]|nr:MAG: tRNA (N6-isopentenyl adenosine(37)-C2)-methylthiotransferase MiaB [Candidatus Rokubacteria bacterium]